MKFTDEKVSEIRIQKAVQQFLSDPSKVYKVESGQKMQVLSPGRINPHEGPDFLDIAILLNGKIIVGDAEFHFCSKQWKEHNHSSDPAYKSVILHIVFADDLHLGLPFETIIVPEKEIMRIYHEQIDSLHHKPDIFSLEELQNFSLIRLLRHTTEAQRLINRYGLEEAVIEMTANFVKRYLAKRRRPSYNSEKLENFPMKVVSSEAFSFIKAISERDRFSIPDKLINLIREKIENEGAGLRREIILNVILPAALTQSDEDSRINLFVWYWSAQSFNKYGVLTRKFPDLPQNFLWQQQGMLEYMRDIESNSSTISDAIQLYGVGNLLSFFQWGISEELD